MFQFINNYISNFVAICYFQNFYTLMVNLIIVMVFKQVFMNLFDYFYERIFVGRKMRKSDDLFVGPLADADMVDDEVLKEHLEVHQLVNRQM